MNKKPFIILVGTGAVGSFYGGKLSQAGAHVSALCRSDYDIVSLHGVRIKSISGDFIFRPEKTMKSISEYPGVPDYIIVATKVLPEIDVCSIIKEKVLPGTSIVLLQNGIEIEQAIQNAFPENEIISAIAFICATREAYGLVRHDCFGRIVIGRYPSGSSDKVLSLARKFQEAGVPCDITEDIITARWKKLLWNAPFNPISVLCGADTKEMMESEHIVYLAKMVMEEICIIAGLAGYLLPEEAIEQNLKFSSDMSSFKTSMLQDYENGKPMEVEAILGNTIRIGKRLGASVPYMESLYALLSRFNEKIQSGMKS